MWQGKRDPWASVPGEVMGEECTNSDGHPGEWPSCILESPLEFEKTQASLRLLIHQHKPGYRGSSTPVLTDPRAFQSREAIRGMRKAHRVVYGLYAVSHTAAPCARTRDARPVPGAALHRRHRLRIQLLQGYQSLTAWQYSFSQDTSYESGELPLAEQSARRYWRSVEGGTVLSHN